MPGLLILKQTFDVIFFHFFIIIILCILPSYDLSPSSPGWLRFRPSFFTYECHLNQAPSRCVLPPPTTGPAGPSKCGEGKDRREKEPCPGSTSVGLQLLSEFIIHSTGGRAGGRVTHTTSCLNWKPIRIHTPASRQQSCGGSLWSVLLPGDVWALGTCCSRLSRSLAIVKMRENGKFVFPSNPFKEAISTACSLWKKLY